ncbi:flagellar hook-basal body complex protein FliE [Pseudochelatococcus contaminans]|uniref:Flagellar hook-basal body complex protein FliE n=1 Tax=Pseudochelatococcus contaminans TaxID=1538103 RepID=A0A7W6EE29_9HYPH|nr:flagellar hook-basal body complex protein FliE [Pseudochelatococcus contaminans]MBB3808024.1 flagellar hook-basal body complex protein FliE [Pseudochelatococcus contaminans]
MVAALNVVNAIGTGVSGVTPTAVKAATTAASAAVDFTAVLGSMITDTAQNLRTSETASLQGLQGRASTQDVVEAVMAAERSLQTTLAVRDKVVAAYQEISRMAI